MTKKEEKILNLLNNEWNKLKTAMEGLEKSIEKCEKIGIKESYSFDEIEAFDSLNSKLARNSDILFQRIFRTIIFLLGENAVTFKDRINLLEKLSIFENTEPIYSIREFRNQIIHEYFIDQIIYLYPKSIELSKQLLKIFQETETYLKNKNWINQHN
jgi:predicted nuclease with TOPRIM domain